MKRRLTRQIRVGSVAIGGSAPIPVQSMTTTYTRDVTSTVAQIHRLTAGFHRTRNEGMMSLPLLEN